MDLHRQLTPLRDALADEVLTRPDLTDWQRERLIIANEAMRDVLTALNGPACRWCGTDVETATTGRPRDYCSSACRQAAYRDRLTVTA